MKATTMLNAARAALFSLPITLAQDPACDNALTPSYPTPVVGSGWIAQLIATNLTEPRSLLFDASGNLLVVEKKSGIRRLRFADGGSTCLKVTENTRVVENGDLTHGIALSSDGKTLFASSAEEVYAWSYDAGSATVGSDRRTVVTNMNNRGHSTRTLLLSQKSLGTLLVSQGSGENVDGLARNKSSGISQLRAFNVTPLPSAPYDYASAGAMLGWGLRNSVGVGEEPLTGGIYSVENSADGVQRDDIDIHQNNPGEELNFHGPLDGSSPERQGGNYGYPDCLAVWSTDGFPDPGTLQVGDQFAPSTTAEASSDTVCNEDHVSPRLTFQAHTAPLDIKFAADGSEAFVTFHGSWDRNEPAGYKLSSIAFANGAPADPPNSTRAVRDILSNANLSACPDRCFRPTGLALDGQGRLFMSSDTTGDIYVLVRVEMSAIGGGGDEPSTTTGTLVAPGATDSEGAGHRTHGLGARAYVGREGHGAWWGLGLTFLAFFFAAGFAVGRD